MNKDRLADLKTMVEIAEIVLDSLPEPRDAEEELLFAEARDGATDILRAVISDVVEQQLMDSKRSEV